MKIELTLNLKDFIIFALIVGLILFMAIKFIQYEAMLKNTGMANQINANTRNIQQIITLLQANQAKEVEKPKGENEE